MVEEDARGSSMRFQEVSRLVKVGEGARRCVFDVMTSVWARREGAGGGG